MEEKTQEVAVAEADDTDHIKVPTVYANRLRVIALRRKAKTGKRVRLGDLLLEYSRAGIDAEYREAIREENEAFDLGGEGA